MQVIKVKRKCPYCKEFKVVKRGHYFVRSKPHYVQRYSCNNCNRNFNQYGLSNKKHIPRWDMKIFRQVKKIINTKMISPFKYDNRKDRTYPSSRMIVNIIYKRQRKRINANTVNKLIQIHRVEV